MKTIVATLMLGLVIATTGAVSASAGDFASDFFTKLSREAK
jgi:hypothetical protein